jgi:AcrR family transcriptional regulator
MTTPTSSDAPVRRSPRQGRSTARVATILSAARQLLQSDDLGDVTVRRIAAHAGVTTASVYRYFADVDEIVDHLLVEHADASATAVHDALAASASRSVGEVFERVLRAFLDLYTDRPDLTIVWRSPALADRQRRHDAAADREIAGEIGRHLERIGLVRQVTPDLHERLAAHFEVAGALLGAVLRSDGTRRQTLEDDLLALVRHLGSRY